MIIIYTDGAARNNPGRAGFGAIVIDEKKDSVTELGGHYPHATNNQMELTAAIRALEHVEAVGYKGEKVLLHTDSSYVIQGMQKWIFSWQKNNWQTSQKKQVENILLWKNLLSISEGKDVEWIYVKGHAGIPLNERSDEIATSFADGVPIILFKGSKDGYGYAHEKNDSVKQRTTTKKKAGTSYYVVVIKKDIFRYETWKECESAVRGVKGVRFKKVSSSDEEERFLDSL